MHAYYHDHKLKEFKSTRMFVKLPKGLGMVKHNGGQEIKERNYYLQIATVTLNDV